MVPPEADVLCVLTVLMRFAGTVECVRSSSSSSPRGVVCMAIGASCPCSSSSSSLSSSGLRLRGRTAIVSVSKHPTSPGVCCTHSNLSRLTKMPLWASHVKYRTLLIEPLFFPHADDNSIPKYTAFDLFLRVNGVPMNFTVPFVSYLCTYTIVLIVTRGQCFVVFFMILSMSLAVTKRPLRGAHSKYLRVRNEPSNGAFLSISIP
mmetsp:Transcript_48897/g.81164  ORF Transcript_48897/g.81164 Transcript_48897/m.81164 type:complete len:205 (+) Transcript_48897:2848-3462(+)